MESHTESVIATWSVPSCPFLIEYIPRVLDDIRLAVVDAFFSLPRGGAEIGGILLGKYEKGRLSIVDYEALPCEHASGPSFVLSSTDHAKLAEMLASARGNSRNLQPVGWYHSHTRSEIFLSEADLEIHKRYFPEAWQVALVLKPHTFHPTKAGFFFREPDGHIHEESCHQEFMMEPLAVRPLPGTAPPPLPSYGPAAAGSEPPVDAAPLAQSAIIPAPPAPSPPPPERSSRGTSTPPYTLVMRRRALRRWAMVFATTLVAAFIAWGYYTRDLWFPTVASAIGAAPPPVAYVGLNALDADGQLQIHWDRSSPAVRYARDAILTIEDGPTPEAIELDPAHLQAGIFTYLRKGARIDIAITLNEPDGKKVREATNYLGKLPEGLGKLPEGLGKLPEGLGKLPERPGEDPVLRKERDDLIRRVDKLAADLKLQKERNDRLEKSLREARQQIRDGQRKRMGNQSRE